MKRDRYAEPVCPRCGSSNWLWLGPRFGETWNEHRLRCRAYVGDRACRAEWVEVGQVISSAECFGWIVASGAHVRCYQGMWTVQAGGNQATAESLAAAIELVRKAIVPAGR